MIRFRRIVESRSKDAAFAFGSYSFIFEPQLSGIGLTKRGESGSIQHFLSKKCINVQSGNAADPPENAQLVYKTNCGDVHGSFIFQSDGLIKHNASGKCIGTKEDKAKPENNIPLVLTSECKSHFEMYNDGLVRHVESKMCWHPRGGGDVPDDGQEPCLYHDCSTADRLKYRWYTPPTKLPVMNVTHSLDTEFAEIEIHTGDDKALFEFSLAIPEGKKTIDKPKQERKSPRNVFVVMFDEVSRAHFRRKMTKTWDLLTKMKAYTFSKHTLASADLKTTLESLVLGKGKEKESIFQLYKNKGYRTLYSNDRQFDGGEAIVGKSIPDHDASLFWKAASRKYNVGFSPFCLGSQMIFMPTCNYFRSFRNAYKHSPQFAFLVMSEITRWNANGLELMDDYFANFIASEILPLDDTVFVLTSGKGSKSGTMSKTKQGKTEGKLPLLSIWLSDDLSSTTKPNIIDANTKIITTAGDVYQTLAHIVEPSLSSEEAYDVLTEKVKERDCEAAGVPPYLCPCE